jgi:hypothetical protein
MLAALDHGAGEIRDALRRHNLLEADPGESRNLRRTHPNVVGELTGRIHRWRADVNAN